MTASFAIICGLFADYLRLFADYFSDYFSDYLRLFVGLFDGYLRLFVGLISDSFKLEKLGEQNSTCEFK